MNENEMDLDLDHSPSHSASVNDEYNNQRPSSPIQDSRHQPNNPKSQPSQINGQDPPLKGPLNSNGGAKAGTNNQQSDQRNQLLNVVQGSLFPNSEAVDGPLDPNEKDPNMRQ